MRRLIGPVLLVPMLLLFLAAPAGAAPPVKDSIEGEFLSAFSSSCGPSVCTDIFVDVFPVADGVIVVCTGEFTFNFHSGRLISQESGCSDEISSTALVLGSAQSSATLAATSVTLFECNQHTCVEGDTVTVSAELTGFGPVFTQTDRGTFSDGTCTVRFSSSTENRSGTGTLTIDGVTTSVDGSFGTGKFTFMERCS
jgi:hypothetical protein